MATPEQEAQAQAQVESPSNGNESLQPLQQRQRQPLEQEQGEVEEDLSLEELLYSSSSYHAIATPVTITMILSALCVVYINTEQTIAQGEEALSQAYLVFDNSSGSTAQSLGLSLVNALIIVTFIGAMTFLIVILYKYRCMKLLLGYMVFASAMLLGFLGGVMFDVAIERYELNIDKFSFYFTLFNFAVVGTVSIFWQKGIPPYITQAYLVATSCILAWQLSHFDDWTAWTLLIMLALYDLCAVLTPCGPLKALVGLMQRDDAPDMPGLLYEAQLPPEARRPQQREQPSASSTDAPVVMEEQEEQEVMQETDETPQLHVATTGRMPLAIAKLYRLELTEPIEPARRRNSFTPLLGEEVGEATSQEASNPNDRLAAQYTPEQLLTEVEAIFPGNGGSIDRVRKPNGEYRYIVKDRHGVVKRILFCDDAGRVFQELSDDENDDDDDDKQNTIKLGLGDFIFYSVLVSKAVQYSFTTFAACMLVILSGLGGTLILLAVYKHALPALPISIFLGVVFYLLTRLLIEPWIETIFQSPLYV